MRRRAVGARGIDCIPFSDRCESVHGRCGKNSYFSRSEKDTQSIPRETLRGPGRPSQLPPPIEGYTEGLGPQERTILDQVLSCASIGTPETSVYPTACSASSPRSSAKAASIFSMDRWAS
jgi:hypothetical protein